MTCSSAGLISFDRAQVAQTRNMTIDTVAYCSNYKDLYGKKNICFCYSLRTREDKGDREGIPHTHPIPQVIRLELFLE